ncbi:MAG: hypothetical protein CMI52_00385 [Parcubacteria group bacterium]|nr:hypothetical protein [Parcubacteria group bacterium]
MHDISIIIVNYKMADFVRDCLAGLKKQCDESPLNIRIVVVDNNSEDHLRNIITQSNCPNITSVFLKQNLGYGGGVNEGIRAVKADYYFVVNPDLVFFEESTLNRLYAFMENNKKIGMCAPKLINTDGSLQYSCWRFPKRLVPMYRRTKLGNTKRGQKALQHFLMEDWDHNQTRPVECVMGSAMFVRGETLKEVGLMSEEYFMYFEDMDWCRQFWNANKPIYYVHDVRIRHHWQRDSAKVKGIKAVALSKLTRIHIKSWLKYMWKWRKVRD